MSLLAVARSLGDQSVKEFVIAEPSTQSVVLPSGSSFIVLACDGVFDVLTDDEVCYIVNKCINEVMKQ
jgi:protein phosphatase PTC1